MHRNAIGHKREDIVRQVRDGRDASLYEWKTYVPIGNAAKKLYTWKRQGVDVLYLTSRRKSAEIEAITGVLRKHAFPDGELLFRRRGDKYEDVIERVMPDVVVEDDCESIGGEDEMIYTHLKPELKEKIKSIVVQEFGGIDHLPDSVSALRHTEENLRG